MLLNEITTKVFWIMLSESSRIEYITKAMNNKLQQITHDTKAKNMSAEQIVQSLANGDPTPNSQYLQFLTNMYTRKQFRLEDLSRIRYDLALYNKVKPKLPSEQRNITMFKTLRDLYKAIAPYENQNPEDIISGKQQKQTVKEQGVNKIIDTPNFKVYQPTTKQAACFYGKGTRWCTAALNDNKFEQYRTQGPIYIIMAGKRKFQFHLETDQFMDEQDQAITWEGDEDDDDEIDINNTSDVSEDIKYLSSFPEYTKFLNMLIQKHYGI